MNHQAINKYLCEVVEKKCWYADIKGITGMCTDLRNMDYFLDSQYLPFLRRCQKEKWWSDFVRHCFNFPTFHLTPHLIMKVAFDPDQMLPAIVKWHEMKER